MGREVKRVDFKFDWYEKTINSESKVWEGYKLNIKILCPLCEGEEKPCCLCYGEKYVIPVIEVPTGEGWQMWETVSEGSPLSPVFKTPEELAKWLADNKISSFGRMTATYEQWLKMIKVGYAPSAVSKDGKLMSGVEGIGE